VTALGPVEREDAGSPQHRSAVGVDDVSHNLNGQKLGRKGRVTRERILAATAELLAESGDTPLSLSAVARRSSLGMTSLYLYFADLTELLLAVLRPVMEDGRDGYFGVVAEYWPDARLEEYCRAFVEDYYAFWSKHSRILHLRNNMADQGDERMMEARVRSSLPVIVSLRKQLGAEGQIIGADAESMASVLMTGIERAVTVATDRTPAFMEREFGPRHTNVVEPLARLMVLAIRDCRMRPEG